eukprot:TRINITY_DN4205_c0_g1_i4.p1 TRINITY_DN4205_c0_g1~~TRINITY_DN4205_c0_g1_i4.p1  ORF type:complete len:198 (+),score=-0.13 TRINITY_DN4205_c0_g1_i4:64-657(+)
MCIRDRYMGENNQKKLLKPCCAKCKKNDKNGKTCVCVVPASQRRIQIGAEGCATCACHGCTREDREMKHKKRGGGPARRYNNERERSRSRSYSREYDRYGGHRRKVRGNSYDSYSTDSSEDRRSRSRSSSEEKNFNNFNKSVLGNFILQQLNVNPALIGFGIPQRTYSYIYGKSRDCLLYTSPSPRDRQKSRMPSSA